MTIGCKAKFLVHFLFAVGAISLFPFRTSAWGVKGHRIVARIAAKHLTPKTRDAVAAILRADAEDIDQCKQFMSLADQLACVSVWADEVRDGNKFPQYKSTFPLHFVNVPIYLPAATRHYDETRDCQMGCVVTAVETYRKILIGSTNPAERAAALKFIVHFVGDLHQPLHDSVDRDRDLGRPENIGNNHRQLVDDGTGDRGGNLKLVTWFDAADSKYGCWNLHSVWDDGMISKRNLTDKTYANKLNQRISAAKLNSLKKGVVIDWVNQALALAVKHAYTLPSPNPADRVCEVRKEDKRECTNYEPAICRNDEVHYRYRLGRNYYKMNLPIVESQLQSAGIHLAKFLNDIFDAKP